MSTAETTKAKIKWGGRLKSIEAFLIWLYLFLQVFVVDVDSHLLTSLAPRFLWLLTYKPLVIAGALLLYWLSVGTGQLMATVIYIGFFPFIVIFWKLPALALKNWMGVLTVFPALIAAFSGFRQRCILVFLAVTSTVVILSNSGRTATALSMTFLLVYLCIHFGRRITIAFAPSSVFRTVRNLIRDFAKNQYVLNNLKDAKLPEDSEENKRKRFQALFSLLMVNRLCLFLARRIQRFQESRLIFGYAMAAIGYTSVLTVAIFALEYSGLHKMNPASFAGRLEPGFVFLYLSFNIFFHVSFGGDLSPNTSVARVLMDIEVLCGFIVAAGVALSLLNVLQQRYEQELDGLITDLNEEGAELEQLTVIHLAMTLSEVLNRVQDMPVENRKFLDYLEQ